MMWNLNNSNTFYLYLNDIFNNNDDAHRESRATLPALPIAKRWASVNLDMQKCVAFSSASQRFGKKPNVILPELCIETNFCFCDSSYLQGRLSETIFSNILTGYQ